MSSSIAQNAPSNKDIKEVLEKGKETVQMLQDKGNEFNVLKDSGRKVLTDAKTLLSDAQILIDKKNRDNRLQKFIQTTADLIDELQQKTKEATAPEIKSAQKEMASMFAEFAQQDKELLTTILTSSRDLIFQIFTSSDFRGLLLDLVDLAQEFFNTATEEAKKKIIEETQPSEAESKQKQAESQATEKITSVERSQRIYTVSREGEAAVNPFTFSAGSPSWSESIPNEHAPILADQPLSASMYGPPVFQEPPKSVSPTDSLGSSMSDASSAEVISQKAQETLSGAQHVFSDRLNRILDRLNSNPKFNEAFRAFLSLVDHVQSQLEAVGSQLQETTTEVASKGSKQMNKMWDNKVLKDWANQARDIVEAFTGKGTWDSFFSELSNFITSLKKDTRARHYFSEWKDYLNSATQNPDRLKDESFRNRAVNLWNRGEKLARELQWKSSTQKMFGVWKQMAHNVTHDPLISKIQEDTKQLFLGTFLNEQGQLVYRPELFQQIRDLFVKMFTDALRHIPIPLLKDTFSVPILGEFDYEIDEWTFSGYDLLPEKMHIRMNNEVEVNIRELQANTMFTTVFFSIKNIQAELKDIHFRYRQRLLPRLSDSGYINVTVGGEGAELLIEVMLSPRVESIKEGPLEVVQVKCHIDQLNVKTHNAHYDIIYNAMSALFAGPVRLMLEKNIEAKLNGIIYDVNSKLNEAINVASHIEAPQAITSQIQSYAKSFLESTGASNLLPESVPAAVSQVQDKGKSIIQAASDVLKQAIGSSPA